MILNLEKGVSFDPTRRGKKQWRARRHVNKRVHRLGWFHTKEEAMEAIRIAGERDPALIRQAANAVDRCCEDAPIGSTLCSKHYHQQYAKGFRFIPFRETA